MTLVEPETLVRINQKYGEDMREGFFSLYPNSLSPYLEF